MAKSLLEVLRDVSLDPSEQAAFSADPSGYLAQYGYEDVHPDDISEAFSLVADTLPPELAQTVSESQAAGHFGGGAAGPGEGDLATNGVPIFGTGYGAGESDPGTDPPEAADLTGPDQGFADDFDGDTAFGEGVSEPDDGGELADLGGLQDDPGLGDTGFGQGEDPGGPDSGYAPDPGGEPEDSPDLGDGYDAGAADPGGYSDPGLDDGGGYSDPGGGYSDAGGYDSSSDTDSGGYDTGGYDSGTDTDSGGYDSGDSDDIGSF